MDNLENIVSNVEHLQETVDKISDHVSARYDRLDDKVEQVRVTQTEQGKDLAVIMSCLPVLQTEVARHKEQDIKVELAVQGLTSTVNILAGHIEYMKSTPTRIAKSIVNFSKVVAAIAAIVAAIVGLVKYFRY